MIFKIEKLEKFFSHISDNYKITSFANWDGSNSIILRHDVDLDIEPAYRLALIEDKYNIKSTFFILLSSSSYNPSSHNNRKLLKSMIHKGFEIGLHFDPSIYPGTDLNFLQKHAENEARVLSEIIESPVKSISLHNPVRYGDYPIFDNFVNAYSSVFFSEEKYISDSRMIFKKDIYEFVKKAKESTIQILLHPLHYTKAGSTYLQIFKDYYIRHSSELDSQYSKNSTYSKDINGDLKKVLSNLEEL